MTDVTVRGFVNRHIVFSETLEIDRALNNPDLVDEHIALLMKHVGPDDLCYLELHFLDDDTYLRFGTDKSAMKDPKALGDEKVSVTRTDTGWKLE